MRTDVPTSVGQCLICRILLVRLSVSFTTADNFSRKFWTLALLENAMHLKIFVSAFLGGCTIELKLIASDLAVSGLSSF